VKDAVWSLKMFAARKDSWILWYILHTLAYESEKTMFETLWPFCKKDSPLRGAARTSVLIDLAYIFKQQPNIVEMLTERGFLGKSPESSLQKYLKKKKGRPQARILVPRKEDIAPSGTSSGPRLAIDLSPAFVLFVEPFPLFRLLYANYVELPDQSRARYDADIGSTFAIEAEQFLDWIVVNDERPLSTHCPVCSAKGKIACSRCAGRGWYRAKSGARRPCGAQDCRGGKVPCYFCKGGRLINCGILRKNNELWLKLPKELRHEQALHLYAGGKKIKRGPHLLVEKVLHAAEQAPQKHTGKDYLAEGEAAWNERTEEMRAFLNLELESSLTEIEAVRVTDGRIAQQEFAASAIVEYTAHAEDDLPWTKGTPLFLLEKPDAGHLAVKLWEFKPERISVEVPLDKDKNIIIPKTGILITRDGLKTVDVQRQALGFWQRMPILLSPVKWSLCFPGRIQAHKIPQLPYFFDERVKSNPAQREAVERALSHAYPLFCIQGPPGTGKTSVICEIIRQELKRGTGKILVSSQSNLAVDNVLERLMEIEGLHLLRLGSEERTQKTIKQLLKQNLISAPSAERPLAGAWFSRLITVVQRAFSASSSAPALPPNTEKALSSWVQVIGATCIGSADFFVRSLCRKKTARGSSIGLVIIDEAGRSTSMETLVPMQFAERVVLVGDQKQLPPTLTAELRQSWQKLHPDKDIGQSIGATSLFEQLTKTLPRPLVSVLNQQFRMHSQIGSLIADVFYRDEQLTGAVDDSARELPLPGLPKALSYHSTARSGDKRFDRPAHNGMSRENPAEAETVLQLLRFIDTHLAEQGISAGVISFYKAQVELLRRLVQNQVFSRLDIDPVDGIATLDSYQGKEKDIIILSLVRCPADVTRFDAGWYKFFLDVRRLNVALSRARRRLFIVGDIERILLVNRNKESVPGFEVMERLFGYVKTHQLAIDLLPQNTTNF
jgi:hypothetical protein